jgi:hypothetical protein
MAHLSETAFADNLQQLERVDGEGRLQVSSIPSRDCLAHLSWLE